MRDFKGEEVQHDSRRSMVQVSKECWEFNSFSVGYLVSKQLKTFYHSFARKGKTKKMFRIAFNHSQFRIYSWQPRKKLQLVYGFIDRKHIYKISLFWGVFKVEKNSCQSIF